MTYWTSSTLRRPRIRTQRCKSLCYPDLYLRILPILVSNEGSIFQPDNALTHTAHVVRDALRDIIIEVMEWPPHSPDLNAIENLQALLKAEIYKLRPDLIHMRNNDETKAILVETAQQAWERIDLEHLKHLSETMRHRVQTIIDSQGWYTPYQQIVSIYGSFEPAEYYIIQGMWGQGVLKLMNSHCTNQDTLSILYNIYMY